ncbi:hypothetical protein SAMN04487917_10933 [Arthrobacter sp. yr096]|uniref:DUF6226 family protein n=1 Tax=Arthrobacter sp. yr096 TaxID=1761750 RepID=UPI0008D5FA04|nr:DUF6226 family protein [Arthrobacter sp. yr096]SEJ66626.1 hypothetical protein SAMN04487917_10933 [Arthrobacter sp. yr096]
MGEIETLFDGPVTGLPAPLSSTAVAYATDQTDGKTVKHLAGYAPFVAFCDALGVPAQDLASNVERLFTFLKPHLKQIAEDPELSNAATVFVGNVIAALRPDACWSVMPDGSREAGNMDLRITVDRLIEGLGEADDAMLAGLVTRLSEWSSDGPDDSLFPELRPVPVVEAQQHFVRPDLPSREYHGEDGRPINYGDRWGADSPPEDSYSVDTHRERFEGLHQVAKALVEYMNSTYDVDVSVDPAHAADLSVNAGEVMEVARVTPRDPSAAPLTFVWTAYPGVVVHAGLLHDFPFPICGCDACDETVDSEATRLEMLVLSVAAGGYGERYPVGRERWAEYSLTAVDGSGSQSGRGQVALAGEGELEAAAQRLGAVPDGWKPWPLRKSPSASD